MPALVRESDAKIIPVSSITPMQYVIPCVPSFNRRADSDCAIFEACR